MHVFVALISLLEINTFLFKQIWLYISLAVKTCMYEVVVCEHM